MSKVALLTTALVFAVGLAGVGMSALGGKADIIFGWLNVCL